MLASKKLLNTDWFGNMRTLGIGVAINVGMRSCLVTLLNIMEGESGDNCKLVATICLHWLFNVELQTQSSRAVTECVDTLSDAYQMCQ